MNTRCEQCGFPRDGSPSDDFCSETCQSDWAIGVPRWISAKHIEVMTYSFEAARRTMEGHAVDGPTAIA